MDKRVQQLIDRYDKLANRERLWILFLGVIILTMFWYFFIFKPLYNKKVALQAERINLSNQIIIYQKYANQIAVEGPKNIANKKNLAQQNSLQRTKLSNMQYQANSSTQNDVLIRAIFTTPTNIKINSLKDNAEAPNKTPGAPTLGDQNLEILFQGNYFDTLAYLQSLENLPWCLSWDTLEYKVLNYPEAEVTLQLHIVNT